MHNREYVERRHQYLRNVEVSFEGENSITIDHVLQTPNDRVQNVMNVENRRDQQVVNDNRTIEIDLKSLQMIFRCALDKLSTPSMCYICEESYPAMKVV